VAGGVADVKNNVENVFLESPGTGAWLVRVEAQNILGDGVWAGAPSTEVVDFDQDFALYCHNCRSKEVEGCPMPLPTATFTPGTPAPTPTATGTPTPTPTPTGQIVPRAVPSGPPGSGWLVLVLAGWLAVRHFSRRSRR
jgi:hypothetical protein